MLLVAWDDTHSMGIDVAGVICAQTTAAVPIKFTLDRFIQDWIYRGAISEEIFE